MIMGAWGRTLLAIDGAAVSLMLLQAGQAYGDVSFSGSEIALIGALLGVVCGALGILFRLVVQLSEARAVRAERLVDDIVPTFKTTAETVSRMAQAQTEQTELIKTLLSGLPDSAPTRRR